VLFASSTASTGVRKVISTTTGPKISTCAIVAAGATSVNRVGGKNQPSRGQLHEGCHSTAPSSRPRCTRSWIFCSCTGAMIAPMSTALSSGSPTRNVSIRPLSLATSRSATPSCTRIREPAQQTWPWLNQIASTTPSTTLSRSASGKTMKGDLPPSSRESFLPLPAVAVRISRPTSVEPVKAILSTSGWVTSASPVRPSPVMMFTTPPGSPISWHSSAKHSAVSEVNSAGLSTTVFPIARAGAIFQASIRSGKFHGMICPITPTGSRPGSSRLMSCAQPA
jgi:hypothetical protein